MTCNATLTVCTTTDDVVVPYCWDPGNGGSVFDADLIADGVAVVRDGDRLMRLDLHTLTCVGDSDKRWGATGMTKCLVGWHESAEGEVWHDDTEGATSHVDNTPPADGCDGTDCRIPAAHTDPADERQTTHYVGDGCPGGHMRDDTPPADVKCRPCSMGHPNECEHPERVCPMQPPADVCPDCDGKRTLPCPGCDLEHPRHPDRPCPSCGGTGKDPEKHDRGVGPIGTTGDYGKDYDRGPCPTCKGKGWEQYCTNILYGSEFHRCRTCGGSGKRPAERCESCGWGPALHHEGMHPFAPDRGDRPAVTDEQVEAAYMRWSAEAEALGFSASDIKVGKGAVRAALEAAAATRQELTTTDRETQ